MALTPAQKQKAYRDRKRAAPIAMMSEITQVATRLLRAELAAITEQRSIVLDNARRERETEEMAARRAEEDAKACGIADGSLHPSGRPWQANEAKSVERSSPRAMMEAGRKAALAQAIDQFVKTGALAADPDGPRRRAESPRGRDYGPGAYWHRDY